MKPWSVKVRLIVVIEVCYRGHHLVPKAGSPIWTKADGDLHIIAPPRADLSRPSMDGTGGEVNYRAIFSFLLACLSSAVCVFMISDSECFKTTFSSVLRLLESGTVPDYRKRPAKKRRTESSVVCIRVRGPDLRGY